MGLDTGEEVGNAFWLVRDGKLLQHRATRESDGNRVLPCPHLDTDSPFDGWCADHVPLLL
jgi:hypothetical protein